jgi:hypothetical protein
MSFTRTESKDDRMASSISTPAPVPLPDEDDVTFIHNNAGALLSMKLQLFGEIDLANQKPVVLEINDMNVSLPVQQSVVLGRRSSGNKAAQPDVDLSAFDTGKKNSISRFHIRIERRDTLIFLTDLASRNGTWLNGQKMIPNAPRLIRDGDELYLGDLKIKVKYPR